MQNTLALNTIITLSYNSLTRFILIFVKECFKKIYHNIGVLTMQQTVQQPLPLPALEQTLAKFLTAIEPVFDAELNHKAQQITEQFAQKHGKKLQQQLVKYAEAQAKLGKSWISDFWLNAYLASRQSKALVSNVGFQVNFKTEATGLTRAAEWIQRITKTHRNFIDNRIETPTDSRGNPLSMDGWHTLKGAMRLPQKGCDDYYYSNKGINNRHVNVFWQGSHYLLPVTDSNGNIFSIKAIETALATLATHKNKANLPFTAISALPSEDAYTQLDDLCQNEHNAGVYAALKDSLFCISLFHSGEDEIVQLEQQTFIPTHAWQYKPFTYQMDLDSDFMVVHIEHTGLDGGALSLLLNDALTQSTDAETSARIQLQPMDWLVSAKQTQTIFELLKPVADSAKTFKVQQFTVDYSAINSKVSHDALFQFSLLYAQLKVFGQLKNTYEAVDTSNYLAGRTECLRPNTASAKLLAKKLLKNSATTADLTNAFAEHKSWVIACKTGQAIDRHLYALQQISKTDDKMNEDAVSKQFFELVNAFSSKDFLSTSTLGGQSPIRRYVFVPTSQGGFGVNYSMDKQFYEFVLIADGISSNKLDAMQQGIIEGTKKLITMIAGL